MAQAKFAQFPRQLLRFFTLAESLSSYSCIVST